MSIKDLKNKKTKLKLGDKEFEIAFDFNAIAELDEVYGDFEKAVKALNGGKGKLKAIRALTYSMIKPRYDDITLLEVGEMLSEIMRGEEKATEVMEQIKTAIELGMPKSEGNEDIEGE